MKTLLITYELKGDRDYSKFYDTLKSASDWWHYLESTWLIKTQKSSADWFKKLKPFMDNVEDSILIVEIGNNANHSGWLPQEAWDWINENV